METAAIDLRPIAQTDAPALATFYNNLASATIRTFRPLGDRTALAICQQLAAENHTSPRRRCDLLAWHSTDLVGWAFLANLTLESPYLGIVVAESWQGKGIGKAMLHRLLAWGREQALTRIYLMVVTDNPRAIDLYTSHGFVTFDEEFDEVDQLPYYHMVVDLGASGS